jgi:hypothetical protein
VYSASSFFPYFGLIVGDGKRIHAHSASWAN